METISNIPIVLQTTGVAMVLYFERVQKNGPTRV